jgi:hypothetical protein
MNKHPFFDLISPDNEEIAAILGCQILDRKTIAEWPLSCVEKVVNADGAEWMLKSNHAPCTIEGDFYSAVDRPFLIKPSFIKNEPPYQLIIYPHINGKPYSLTKLSQIGSEKEIFRNHFAGILESLYDSELPVYLKIDTKAHFLVAFRKMISSLVELVESGTFSHTKGQDIEELAMSIESTIMEDVALQKTTLVHGDFSIDNLLFTPTNGYYILDWQRPIFGSPLIDEYTFIKSNGAIPEPPAILIGSLVQIYWFVDCAVNWFPAGSKTYDQQVKGLIEDFFNAYQSLNKNNTNK